MSISPNRSWVPVLSKRRRPCLRVSFPSVLLVLFFALWVRSRLGQLSEIIVLRPQATIRTVPGTQGHKVTRHKSVSWRKAPFPKAAMAKNWDLEDCTSSSLSSLLLDAWPWSGHVTSSTERTEGENKRGSVNAESFVIPVLDPSKLRCFLHSFIWKEIAGLEGPTRPTYPAVSRLRVFLPWGPLKKKNRFR